MGYRNKTYVIFDGDEDIWAYGRMKGWKALKNIDFNFFDAHDLKPLTKQAKSEAYIKQRLAERIKNAKQVIVLIGEKTNSLYRFVRWEIEQAQKQNLPIIAVNLNNLRSMDNTLCPRILKNENAVHIAFRMKIIKYALDYFPTYYKDEIDKLKKTNWYYDSSIYKELGIDD